MASKSFIVTLMCVAAFGLVVTGCGSDDETSPVAPPVDTAPPALPGNPTVVWVAAEQAAVVTWDANVTDQDLVGYVLARGDYEYQPAVLNTTPQMANRFQDAIQNNHSRWFTYYVYAVDTSDNMSAAATVQLHMPGAPEDGRTPPAFED